MLLNRPPERWTRTPPGLSNIAPYWRDRGVNSAVFASAGGYLVDFVARDAPSLSGTLPPLSGGAWKLNGSSNAIALPATRFRLPSPVSRIALIQPTAFSGTQTISSTMTTGGAGGFQMRLNGNTLSGRSGAGEFLSSTIPASAGSIIAVGMVVAGTYSRTFANGKVLGSGNGTDSFGQFNASPQQSLIGTKGDGSNYFGGLILGHVDFANALTDADMQSLTDGPYGILSIFSGPRRLIVFGGVAAALSAGASSEATAYGTLTTAIPLASVSGVSATASGTLTTQIALSGSAASVSIAGGTLTATIRLSGSALAQMAASGVLSAQIRLSGSAVMQALASAGMTTGAGLAAAASATASGSASLTTAIPLSGSASAIAYGSGGITTQIRLAGAAAGACNATGSLLVSIRLSGGALAQATASGTLSTQIQLSAAAVMQALASATLTDWHPPVADPRYRAPGVARAFVCSARRRVYVADLP